MTGAAAVAQVIFLLSLLSGPSAKEKEEVKKEEAKGTEAQVMKLIEVEIKEVKLEDERK